MQPTDCRFPRLRLIAAVAVVALMLAVSAESLAGGHRPDRPAAPAWTRIRPLQPRARQALVSGYARSETLHKLIDELEALDVVVYVDLDPYRAHSTAAFLQFMGKVADLRYVLAWADPRHDDEELTALLGHELEHALEVACAPDVVTTATFEATYRSLGHPSGGARYETQAAHDVAARIRVELFSTAPTAGGS